MGILEEILAELRQIKAQLGMTANNAPPQTYTQPPQEQHAPPTATLAPAAPVTAEAITALIQPHIANEAIKTALGAAMRGMGINALPETQPHQYGELYSRFQAIIAQYTGGGAPAPQQQAASII